MCSCRSQSLRPPLRHSRAGPWSRPRCPASGCSGEGAGAEFRRRAERGWDPQRSSPELSSIPLSLLPSSLPVLSSSQGPHDPVPRPRPARPLTPRPMSPLLKGSPMRLKAASWMKYGLRIRISGGSLGTRVATDFQKPSDALCGHSTAGREPGTRLRGDCVRGRGPRGLQADEKQGGGREEDCRHLGHVG